MVFEQVFDALYVVFNTIFGPLLVFSPIVSLMIISAIFSILVYVINKIFINKTVMRQIREKMEELSEKAKEAQKVGNNEEAKKFFDEMMKTQSEQFRHTIKALIISIVVISLFIPWIRYRFSGAPIGNFPFAVPFLGVTLDWFWWYVIVSFAVGWVVNKLLGTNYP